MKRGGEEAGELQKWGVGLLLFAVVGGFLVMQANGGVFSFFKQIPTNFTSYDSGDEHAYVRWNTATLQLEYRQTAGWSRFDPSASSFVLNKVSFSSSLLFDAFKSYWYEGIRADDVVSFSQGTLYMAQYPSLLEGRTADVTYLPVFRLRKAIYLWTDYECTEPCIHQGDLAAQYYVEGANVKGVFILRSYNVLDFVNAKGSTTSITPAQLIEAKRKMLAYRDGYLDTPLSFDGKNYCVQYATFRQEGHLVIDLAKPVEEGTLCDEQ